MKIIKNITAAAFTAVLLSGVSPVTSYAYQDLTGVSDEEFYDTHTFQTADTKPAISSSATVTSAHAKIAYDQLVAANPSVEAQLSALMNQSGGNAALVALAGDPASANNILSMFDPRDMGRVVTGLQNTSVAALETTVQSFASPEELHYYQAQLTGLSQNEFMYIYHNTLKNPDQFKEAYDAHYKQATSENCAPYCLTEAEEEYYWEWDEDADDNTTIDGEDIATLGDEDGGIGDEVTSGLGDDDGDGILDNEDADDDGDGIADLEDSDDDGDGIADLEDADYDGDDIADLEDGDDEGYGDEDGDIANIDEDTMGGYDEGSLSGEPGTNGSSGSSGGSGGSGGSGSAWEIM